MSVILNKTKSCYPKLSISMPPLEILLIEDNQQEAYLIRRTLNQIGNIYWDETLEDGLKASLEKRFDLALISLNLNGTPSLDPFSVLFHQKSKTPIIVLSCNETKLLAEAATHQGAMAILDKNMLDNSEYLIKMITAFMIKAKFIKKAEELISKSDKENKGPLSLWSQNKPQDTKN